MPGTLVGCSASGRNGGHRKGAQTNIENVETPPMQTDTTRENPQGTLPQAADSNSDLSATAPGQLRVIKRNGTVVPYTD